ncbi:hypothetical protein DFQ28_001602 [Apophysomyces sp. BC1034]|nr:hypothetical protein DFQ29_001048 [Apophysomyces sp. BC1021]KAG0190755.1 hypothetical protein DFQ28_001602 [Apophysomyces sp. BC1034]
MSLAPAFYDLLVPYFKTQAWTTRYAKSLAYFYRETLKQHRPVIRSKGVDWGARDPVMRELLKATAVTLTAGFIDEFRASHGKMETSQKWVLTSGKIVDDVIYSYSLKCEYEQ